MLPLPRVNPWLENKIPQDAQRDKKQDKQLKISTVDEKTKEFCGLSSKVQKKREIISLYSTALGSASRLGGGRGGIEMKKDLSSDGRVVWRRKKCL